MNDKARAEPKVSEFFGGKFVRLEDWQHQQAEIDRLIAYGHNADADTKRYYDEVVSLRAKVAELEEVQRLASEFVNDSYPPEAVFDRDRFDALKQALQVEGELMCEHCNKPFSRCHCAEHSNL